MQVIIQTELVEVQSVFKQELLCNVEIFKKDVVELCDDYTNVSI